MILAGLYIHIPFCKQACHYCDFHFSTQRSKKQELLQALAKELEMQQGYLGGDPLRTVYFGGGTPSMLSPKEIGGLIDTVYHYFRVHEAAEVTLEANPDDLDLPFLKNLRDLGINRLSVGVQSFQEDTLVYLNRAHHAREALDSLMMAREAGFVNINVDLIYGIPIRSDAEWESDLGQLVDIRPEHVSAYCLTIEEKTVFGHWLKKGKIKNTDEDFSARQFEILLAVLSRAGYQQYEISNFSLPGKHSRHNSNYWKQGKYLGIGPSAHSYNGVNRQFNVAHNHQYVDAINSGRIPCEIDALSREDHVNEYILTTLRTVWGVDLYEVKSKWGVDIHTRNQAYLTEITQGGFASLEGGVLTLSDRGKLLADKIAADLFVTL